MIIPELLARNARKFGNRVSIITRTTRMSYQQLEEETNRLAHRLIELGIEKGNRIGIVARNNEQFLRLYFAILKCGGIVLPLNVHFTPRELKLVMDRFSVSALLYEEVFHKSMPQERDSKVLFHSAESLMSNLTSYSPDPPPISIQEEDLCLLFLTSGTTGVPKGALYDHRGAISVATSIAIEFKHRADDRVLHMMPFSHSAPLQTFFLPPLLVGAIHILDDYDPGRFIQWLLKERITTTFAAPIAYILAANHGVSGDFSHVRIFAYGASPFPTAAFKRVTQAFQHDAFLHVYGLTESGPNGIRLFPEEHQTKNGSIGRHATVNMEIKLVNEKGEETAPGEYGEILLSGECLMIGYADDKEATQEAIQDGWLHTGDIAYRDEDGYIFIVDRKKDVILSGGINIYPREVEEVLNNHPNILESAVLGVDHPEWGETVKAVIVPKPGKQLEEASLHHYVCMHLADFKRPKIYTFVEELPRNANGKVMKYKLKDVR